MPGFGATTAPEGERLVVALSGECDLAVRTELATALRNAVARSAVVVVDLAELEFIDSTGINEIIAAHHAAARRRGAVYVRNGCGPVAAVLAVTGVGTLLAMPESST